MDNKTLFSFLSEIVGQGNVIAVPRYFIEKLNGNIEAALFLSQLIYWSGKSVDGWIYKTYSDWEKELYLKEKKVRTIKTMLEEEGLISTVIRKSKGSPTVHYHVNEDVLGEWILPKREIGNGQNGGIETAKMAESSIAKITYKDYKQIYSNSKKVVKSEETKTVEIITYLNEKAHKNYSTDKPAKAYTRVINARLKEKRVIEEFKRIIDYKVSTWLNDENMNKYLNPETLFRDSNFDKYLEQMRNDPNYETEEEKQERLRKIIKGA